ncbi:MAG: HTH domain-containing protein [Candidatus Latescibacterota bacterium]
MTLRDDSVVKRQDTVLTGRDSRIVAIPRREWEMKLLQMPRRHAKLLRFMTPEHHRVRHFVVCELPRKGGAVAPGYIAEKLNVTRRAVSRILEDLEKNLFFLVRNDMGAVTWAYPVTVEETPHKLEFSTGERLFAA